MPISLSEAYLQELAHRTFLKLWAVPNAYRASAKELADLVIVFGDDVIIFSDKACAYGDGPNQATRWRRAAIDESVKQLKGALRELMTSEPRLFTDDKAKIRASLADILPPRHRRRIHLVAVARPDHDPADTPMGWPGLRMVSHAAGSPLELELVEVGGHVVHIFDGPTIDMLLEHLGTAPDFIAYLGGRERALRAAHRYDFREPDLLAAAILNWGAGDGCSPCVPDLDTVQARGWDRYLQSGGAQRSRTANEQSKTIDRLISHFDACFDDGAYLTERPTYRPHEFAMRLLAAESRFSRRMIVAPLDDIMREEDQSTFWSATVPSPSRDGLRYLWVTYPQPPTDAAADVVASQVDEILFRHILRTAAQFQPEIIVGILMPNRACTDNLVLIRVFDASSWTDEDRAEGLAMRDGFGEPRRIDFAHVP